MKKKGRGKVILRMLPGQLEMKARLRVVVVNPVVNLLRASQGKKGIIIVNMTGL